MNKEFQIENNSIVIRGVIENSESRKLVILAHGFTGDLNGPDDLFKKLSEILQDLDYTVLRFSFWGTKPSSGEFEDMTVISETSDLEKIVAYANNLGYKEIWLLGESLWWTIIANAYCKSLKFMIFWYSAFELNDTDLNDIFLNPSAKKELSAKWYVSFKNYKVWKDFISEIPKLSVYNKLNEISCPVLLVHGDSDIEVPLAQSEKAYSLLVGKKELKIIHWAWHCFRNEHEEAIEITTNFIKKYL